MLAMAEKSTDYTHDIAYYAKERIESMLFCAEK